MVDEQATGQEAEDILQKLIDACHGLSPQRRKAARYLIDHPDEIAVVPLRQLAQKAGVKTSTLVRVANAIGFQNFSQLRSPFRARIRIGSDHISERARQLESRKGSKGQLYAGMAEATVTNLEILFSQVDLVALTNVARSIISARRVFVTAVGSCYPLAHYFHYVTRMALGNVFLTPQPGGLPVDDMIQIDSRDVILLMSFRPYRRETIDVAELARDHGAKVVAITDSRTSPIAMPADTVFVVPTETPQFFPSISAALALLETLLAFIVKQGGKSAVGNIEEFDRMRHQIRIWWQEPE